MTPPLAAPVALWRPKAHTRPESFSAKELSNRSSTLPESARDLRQS